jgi:hypothetical protein
VTPFGGAKSVLFTSIKFAAAKVIHRRLRRGEVELSSPPVNNFGRAIRAGVRGKFCFPPVAPTS